MFDIQISFHAAILVIIFYLVGMVMGILGYKWIPVLWAKRDTAEICGIDYKSNAGPQETCYLNKGHKGSHDTYSHLLRGAP